MSTVTALRNETPAAAADSGDPTALLARTQDLSRRLQEREEFYQESKVIGELLGIPPGHAPDDLRGFEVYVEESGRTLLSDLSTPALVPFAQSVKESLADGERHAVSLEAENPEFEPIEVDLRRDALVIEGIAVGVIRNGRSF